MENQKAFEKTFSRPPHSKSKKIQGIFKDKHKKFKDFSRTFPKIHGLFKTVRTVIGKMSFSQWLGTYIFWLLVQMLCR